MSNGPYTNRSKIESTYRSRSQPLNLDFKTNLQRRGGGKRARSQTVHLLDAIAQIGTECKTAETQYQDTASAADQSMQIKRKHQTNLKSLQPKIHRMPDQRCVVTQIGPSSKESSTQVESCADLPSIEECYMTEDMKGVLKRSDYRAVESKIRKSARNTRPPVVQVNTCTQLGQITHERSVSPIHAFRLFCPKCQNTELIEAQKEYEVKLF